MDGLEFFVDGGCVGMVSNLLIFILVLLQLDGHSSIRWALSLFKPS
jgi:hypothetical protein